jgi:hypothetical protein
MKHISQFKQFDKIVRVEPAEPYGGKGGVRDRSYLGVPFIFIGIANGMIYLEYVEKECLDARHFGIDKSLTLDVWSNGWDLYFDPMDLKKGIKRNYSKSELEKMLQDALDSEDYETAESLKQQIANL